MAGMAPTADRISPEGRTRKREETILENLFTTYLSLRVTGVSDGKLALCILPNLCPAWSIPRINGRGRMACY
jgi:hypothetical protein